MTDSTDETPTPPRRRRRPPRPASPLALLERNLERYPWARLSDDKGDLDQLALLLDGAGEAGRSWIVTAGEGARLPGPFDADVYVPIGQLYNAARRPESRTVRATFLEFAALMGRSNVGGGFYEALEASLHRLARVTVTAAETFRVGEDVARLKTFSILTAETRHPRDGSPEGRVAIIRLSEDVAASIAAGNFRLLDAAEYLRLDHATARALYRRLDARRWRGTERQRVLAFSLKELAALVPIDREAPSHIKRTLDPAHAELIARGILTSATYEERPVAGKKRPAWWVVYTFAEAPPETLPEEQRPAAPPADEREAPDYLREAVAEILAVLRDPHSTAFYAKAAKALPADTLRNVLGGVRQALREGLPLDAARKTFTAAAKARAKALGVDL